jgi:hypothetical protein
MAVRDGDDQKFIGYNRQKKRHPYMGNKNPSRTEFAREGYETLACDTPSDWSSVGDRETIADENVEFNPRWTNFPW